MSDDGINGNEKIDTEKRSTIIRVVHNRENPYVQLNKSSLWDSNLSLKAVGLWSRCMSRPDNWKFSVKELVNRCKEGRRAVDGAMDELIKAGYVCRLEYTERNPDGKYKTGGVEYVFFEYPATEEEKQKQLEIFKKSFQRCGFGDCRNGDCRNVHLLIKNKTNTESTEDKESSLKVPHGTDQTAVPAAEPQPAKAGEVDSSSPKGKTFINQKAVLLVDRMIKSLQAVKPDFKVPKNLSQFLSQADFMIRLDGRDPQRVMDVFNWALSDPFWMDKMFKPNPAKYLREKFDQLEMKMKVVKPKPQLRPEDMPLDLSKIDPLILKRVREAKERGEYDN